MLPDGGFTRRDGGFKYQPAGKNSMAAGPASQRVLGSKKKEKEKEKINTVFVQLI